jgi:hypothetical protein
MNPEFATNVFGEDRGLGQKNALSVLQREQLSRAINGPKKFARW